MVLGACAILSLIASVAVAYSNTDHGNIFLIIALVSLAVFTIGFVYWFPKSYMGRNLTSTSAVGDLGIDLSELINKTGSAYTNLRPSGTAVIGDDRVDVVTEGTFVEKDRPVKVVAVEGQRVVVREVDFLTYKNMNTPLIVMGVGGLILFILAIVILNFGTTWLRAYVSGAKVTFMELIQLQLRKIPIRRIVDSRITAVKSGIPVSIDDLSTHFLAGGQVQHGDSISDQCTEGQHRPGI